MEPDYDLQAAAQSEMAAGERLLWVGRPDPKRTAMPSLGALLFGIPWTAFSIFWVAMAWSGTSRSPHPGGFAFFPLFGVPFVLIGLGMLSSPFWMYRRGQQTVYAVSDRRALIIAGGRTRSVRSFSREDIGTIERTDRPDGSGNVVFARPVYNGSSNSTSSWPGNTGAFYGIPDARGVERLLRDTFKSG